MKKAIIIIPACNEEKKYCGRDKWDKKYYS